MLSGTSPFFLSGKLLGSLRLDAFATTINTSTLVAEVLAAPTGHMIAAFRSFDPEVAVRALLELLTLGEVEEGCIQLISVMSELIVLAGFALMVCHLAGQAVVLFAQRTAQLVSVPALSS